MGIVKRLQGAPYSHRIEGREIQRADFNAEHYEDYWEFKY
jgi:hypothetical protein